MKSLVFILAALLLLPKSAIGMEAVVHSLDAESR